MKININKKSLLKCLDTVNKAVPQRAIMPITHNFLFVVMKNTCTVYAYNGKLQIKGQFAVESKEDFGMCVPANTLMNTVKLLSDEEFVFNYDPAKFILNIIAGKKKYKMSGFNPKDFPIQKVKGDDLIEIKLQTSQIIDHIKRLSNIVDWSEMRESLAGVTMLVNNGVLEITGVHGGRYFYRGITSIKPETDFGIVLHKDISVAIGQALGKGDTEIVVGKRNLSVKMDGFEYTSVLMDVKAPLVVENYFDYDSEKYIVIDKNEFLGSLRRLSNYSNEDSTLLLEIKGNELKLNSENVSYSIDAEEIIDIQNKDVEDRVFGLSINYLLSILGNISGEKIKILNGTGKIKMVCIQDYENVDYTEMWGLGEFVINAKTEVE